jgi:lectin-like protein
MRLFLFVAIAATGCLRQTQFHCTNDQSCGASGRCEASSYCSFPDSSCSSMYRYGSSAGTYADQCTNAVTGDGGVDSPIGDGSIDAPILGCPSGYDPLSGVTNGHVYKLLTAAGNWNNQQAACLLTTQSAYLAIPDDATELAALDTLAGTITEYWVGITDSATEGTFLNVLGAAQTFLPWDPPAPDNNSGGQGEDCVEAITALAKFNDLRCTTSFPAICECAP